MHSEFFGFKDDNLNLILHKSCCGKCIKAFSGYEHFARVTGMLSSFDTVISNSKCSITLQCEAMDNLLVRHFISLGL